MPLLTRHIIVLIAVISFCHLEMGGMAQAMAAPDSIEVTADQALEWYKDKRLYIARGNAKAVRGETVLEADTLTVRVCDTKKITSSTAGQSNDIESVVAEGRVRISTPSQRMFGDRGVYDLAQGIAILTGDNLRYEAGQDVVTARDTMEYHELRQEAVARGHAVAVGVDRKVEADVLVAQFSGKEQARDALTTGTPKLSRIKADGHVVVYTKNDVSRADHGIYDLERHTATLLGRVTITRSDGTQLSGDRGEVDFDLSQSRLLNDGKAGRVRALLPIKGKGE